tara:strand:+ start:721 stop:975 length:255 start_codon:yes stop_codon:yes gene_type:complete
MEMVSKNPTSGFKAGDLVKWWYSSPEIPYIVDEPNKNDLTDIGIVLSVENWEGDDEIKQVIEVYFAKGGANWCNPKSLELVSKY